MSLFDQQTNLLPQQQEKNNDSYFEKKYKWMFDLVGDKSVFGMYYTKICQVIQNRNVPSSRLPTREHFMSKIIAYIDQQKLSEWLEKYIELEAINDDTDDLENK